ncbi:MAG: hypothetical protein GXO71_05720 [Caldiserica bacterium]|nr:hypothetical protein [Caldisericota bacterium]
MDKSASAMKKILEYICERYNRLVSEGVSELEELAIGTTVKRMDPSMIEEINQGRTNPLKPASIERTLRGFKKQGYLEPIPTDSALFIPTDKAFAEAGIERAKGVGAMLSRKPFDVPRDKVHKNVECRVCLIVDGYLPEENECRHCGALLLELDVL